ncbi:Protein N-acetyltransferase, RimJ/RimL family [Streptomyces sp. 1331.2]|nr:Protein N-acetyltransferase, RimJ/RimL family [Streptomyces sp. 1331.2]
MPGFLMARNNPYMDELPTEPVTLTTERLVLRAPQENDIDAVYTACQDAEIQRWTVVPSPYRREDAEFFVRELAGEGWRTGANRIWCVFERESGALVGSQALVLRDHDPRCAEVGWWATKEFRGRGYTVEAARAVAHYGLRELGLRRLEWQAYVGNEGSRAVADRVGYRFEGTLRSYAEQRGVFHDAWLASLLASDLD